MNLKMYKACLRLFFLGMVLFFTAIPSLADESRYDEPSYLLWRRLLENDIEDKNPKPRDKQERSLEEDVEEKSPFYGEKSLDDKHGRALEEDVEEKSPFAGEKSPDDKEAKRLLQNDLVDKRPKKPKRLLSADVEGRSLKEVKKAPPYNPNWKRILATDVEEKSPFSGEKSPDDEEEKSKKLLENDIKDKRPNKRGRLLSADVEGRSLEEVKKTLPHNPNWKRILATDVEVENPLYVEKLGRLLEEESKTRKLDVDEESPNDEGEKLGRLLADELKKSPFYDGKTSNYDIENPTGLAKAPGMSPSHNKKSSKVPHKKGRTYGSFYVEKPREHQPLIMNPQHHKSPHRRLLGESLGQ